MEVEVTVVDDVVYGGESHRRITYRCTDSSAGWFSVTEGLGPEQGLLCFPQYANLTSGGGHAYKTYYNLQSVTDTAGDEVWSADNRPWDGDSVEETQSIGSEGIPVYDLQGRRVNSPEHGLYVRGKKKIIVGH